VSVPSEPVPVPAAVVGIAEGRQVVAVWVNELGGVTFDVDGGREYVKVSPPEWAHHLVAEAERLRWAAAGRRSTRAGWPIRAPRHGR
jgi:kanamycin kinase